MKEQSQSHKICKTVQKEIAYKNKTHVHNIKHSMHSIDSNHTKLRKIRQHIKSFFAFIFSKITDHSRMDGAIVHGRDDQENHYSF